ncbi:OmpA family protein [Alteromonadaceae bacterium BrNp21-10]|nr:OmpA family protein [Alteromonadaceae bacterium BrNp21-10]
MRVKFTLALLLVAAISGCASQKGLTDTDALQKIPVLSQAKTQLQQAQESRLDWYSPSQMAQASDDYQQALKQAKAGKPEAVSTANKVLARIGAAQKQAEKAQYVFEDVLSARDKAIKVNASQVASNEFNRAESELTNVLALLEVGETDKAKRDINALRNQYLDIELNALKANMLSVAEKAIAEAKKKDIDDVAPRTIAMADDEYGLALATLEANRDDTQKANVHSQRAIWLVQRANGIVELVRSFDNAKFDEEQKILWYQDQVSKLVSPINTDVGFNQPNKEVVNGLSNAIAKIVNERQLLQSSLDTANQQLLTFQQQSESREQALTRDNQQAILSLQQDKEQALLSLQRDKEQAVLEANLALEQEQAQKRSDAARFAKVQSMFSENEATVYRQLDNVLIRAQGFAFKPGSSEIESSNFVLLNKIIDAIKRFPNARVVVSGHTDNTGSEELNLQLSIARANTVASFLVQVGLIPAELVEANGFGKDKPVASNETIPGRAENRRVEVLIVNTVAN